MNIIENAVIIHPKDKSTEFLNRLYSEYSTPIIADDTFSDDKIRELMSQDDRLIVMLGHGCPSGLFSPAYGFGQFGRLIVNNSHIDLLRNHECIGIWCYAVEFAKRYGLHGLFSGMIISELEEAQMLGINGFTRAEISMYNQDFIEALYDCINKHPLNEVPDAMANYISNPNAIEKFNFNNLYYL